LCVDSADVSADVAVVAATSRACGTLATALLVVAAAALL